MSKKLIVVGAGFGGLTAAALLAHEGLEVTILEKNEQVGGRAHVWKEKGFTFNMGPSWYLMPEVFDGFFAQFGKKRGDYYSIIKLDPYYRVFFSPEEVVDISANFTKNMAVFDRFEENGGGKLKKYLEQAAYKYDIAMKEFIYKEYHNLFDFFNKKLILEGIRLNIFNSLDKFVERYFKDNRAKKILEYTIVFLGNSPYNAPALYSIMSHVDINLGVWYPYGGMGVLVQALRELAELLGVKILLQQDVKKIEVKNGKVRGVLTDKENFEADVVLVNADYAYAETRLLGKPHQSYPKKYWEKRVFAPSMYIIYLGLNKKLDKLAHHNLYFAENWDEHFADIFDKPAWPEHPSYYVSCPSRTDNTVAPPGCENISILVPIAHGLEDNDNARERYFDEIMGYFEGFLKEGLRDAILVKRIFTQRDFRSVYHAYDGSALGIAHTLCQTAVFRPSHKSKKVKNLYYTGQYTHPGVGVPMTFISSQIVSKEIIREIL